MPRKKENKKRSSPSKKQRSSPKRKISRRNKGLTIANKNTTPKIVNQVISATGKRKAAIAQVRLFLSGQGKILTNKKKITEYFPYFEWQKIIQQPLDLTKQKDKVDIIAKLNGGGIKAQAEALRLGISRALIKFNPDFRKILKPQGLLKRDARVKERKKPGLKRARRAPQWSKR